MYTCPFCDESFWCDCAFDEHMDECLEGEDESYTQAHESMRKTKRMPWEER